MLTAITVTKRERRRRLKSGEIVLQIRYVLNYRDPRTGGRKQLFFERQKDAQHKASELAAAFKMGTYAPQRTVLTIKEAVGNWLRDRESNVKARTYKGYKHV